MAAHERAAAAEIIGYNSSSTKTLYVSFGVDK